MFLFATVLFKLVCQLCPEHHLCLSTESTSCHLSFPRKQTWRTRKKKGLEFWNSEDGKHGPKGGTLVIGHFQLFLVFFKMVIFSCYCLRPFLSHTLQIRLRKYSRSKLLGTISRCDLWVITFLSFPLVCVNAIVSMFDSM